MSVLNQSGEEQVECPLCMEPLEVDDLNFYPCTCGYQICRFCWHRIRTDENGLCPACRKAYSENPADFTPLSKEQVAQLKAEKRARDQQRKAKLSESRKHLASVRVVQRNLVFVVGLPVRLADAEVLRRHEYFGKFGKIHKVVINQSTGYAGSQGPSASAYVTYYKSEDALRAIQSVNNITLDGRLIKSSLGTTKYCSHFMKNQICPKPDCMYLHELGDAEASFTKEEMHQGKHQEYEKRLHEALAASQGTGGGTGKQTGSQQSSQNNGTVIQKEAWPSLSRNGSPPNVGKERKSSTSESKQSSQNNNKTDSSARAEKENTNSNAHPTKPTEKSQRNKHSKFNKHNSTNNNTVSQNNNDNAMNTKNQKMSETKMDKNTANVLEKNSVHNANLIISNGENKKSLNVENIDGSKQKIDMTKKESTEKSKSSEVSEATDTDRSDNSSPITQNLSKMSLYEDNTSFFSPNTFQKLISDNESASFGQENSSVPQTSNILNDNLPDISSSEDWEAAFGFSTTKTTPYSNLSRTSDSPGSSSGVSLPRTSQSDSNVYGSQFGGVSSLNVSDQMLDGSVNGLSTHRSDVVNSVLTSSNNTNSAFSDTNSAISVNNSSNRNSMFASLSLQEPVDDVLTHLQKNSDQLRNVNGLDHNMYKFFADFHKNNSLQKEPHEYMNGFGTDHAHAAHPNSLFGSATIPDRQSIGNVQEHLLNGSQQNSLINQQNMLYHQRLMEKQFSDQQLLMNLKNQQQNGSQSPHNLLTNHQTFLNQHAGNSGYQQNFLLQNQINLVQNQHNIIGSVDHGLIVNQNLINNQQNIIGNPQNIINNQQNIINSAASNSLIGNQQHNLFTANQQNLLSNPQTLLNSQASLLAANQQQNMLSAAQQSLINQQNHHISNIGSQQGLQVGMLANHSLYPQSQQSLHNLIENQKNAAAFGFGVTNQHVIGNTSGQQRVTDDDLGFDPFHETQKALAELMESEQVVNNQQQHRTRLPPPGFSHMNAFGIGLPRPHGSKILPFMGLGGQTNSGTQQPTAVSSQQPTSNGWSMHAQQPNISQSSTHKGLGVINDWTTLDPAIVSSSRHYPLANMPPLRDQFATNMQHANLANGQIRGLDFTNPQQQQQQQQPNNGYQQGNGATAFAPSVFQQQNGGQQNAPSSQSFNSQQPQNLIANGYTSTHSWLNATDFQNQIPLPPGFRQNNQQSKTQEC